jgi:heme-degrading monooxygenase HmoA
MIALFFEVTPKPGQDDRYLDIAASLKPELERSGGVVFLDRYRSLSRPRTLLSHQIWIDEASLARWRANARHYGAQTAGRNVVFEDYRLRVGPVVAEMTEDRMVREHAPGIAYNDAARRAERFVVVCRGSSADAASDGGETYRSVYTDNAFAWVGAVPDRRAGLATLEQIAGRATTAAAQLCLVSRDYGLHDRDEAPQYFPSPGAAVP